MSQDLYLKFTDEAAATAVLNEAVQKQARKEITFTQYLIQGEPDEDGDVENYVTAEPQEGDVILDSWPVTTEVDDPENTTVEYRPLYANISTIGIIYKPTGETDAEGNPVMAALDGWHVNVRVVSEDPTPLQQYAVTPTLPVRVWG